jgi:hypothetical protein
MKSQMLGRFARCAAVLLFAPFLAVGAGVTAGCGDAASCTRVRDATYSALEVWQACDPGDATACIIEPGNPKDCTGVLTCAFAVNPAYRAIAEQTMLSIGEQSHGCYQCSVPNCLSGSTAYCEPVSRRCLMLGTVSGEGGTDGEGGLTAIVQDAGDADRADSL